MSGTAMGDFLLEAQDEASSLRLSKQNPDHLVWGKDRGGRRGYVAGRKIETSGTVEVQIGGVWHEGRLESIWCGDEPWPLIYIGPQAIGIPHRSLIVRRPA